MQHVLANVSQQESIYNFRCFYVHKFLKIFATCWIQTNQLNLDAIVTPFSPNIKQEYPQLL